MNPDQQKVARPFLLLKFVIHESYASMSGYPHRLTRTSFPFHALPTFQAQYGELVKGHTEAQTSKPGKWNLPFPDVSGA